MSTYGAGVSGVAGVNVADTVLFQLRPISTAERLYVRQLVMVVLTVPTNALTPYLVRSSAIGTVSTTLAGQPIDPADGAAIGTFDSAFSVAPTKNAANKIAVGALPATAGAVWVWNFYEDELVIDRAVATGVCIAINATGATLGSFSASALWKE